jgi:acyl-CoA thioesterase
MSGGELRAATHVDALGDGRYAGEVLDGWDVAGNAHGGYLLSIAARALAQTTGRPDPVSVTAHYLRSGRPGPVQVETDLLRSGRRFATATATMHAGDDVLLSAIATFGDLAADTTDAPELIDGAPPELPPWESLSPVVPAEPFPPRFMGHLDLRLHPDDATFLEGRRSGRAHIRGWLALPGDEPIDTIALLTLVDAFPPTVFNVDLPIAWVPTLELTAHVRARPAPGPLACEVRTRFISAGFLEVDGEYWDGSGRLVAQSRQLALVPRAG